MDSINWDAVSAIGQVFGSVITAVAVVIALRKDKPKIYLNIPIRHYDGKEMVEVHVTNIGYIPVTILTVTCLFSKQISWTIFDLIEPTYLAPGETHTIAQIEMKNFKKLDSKDFKEIGKYEIWESLCVVDHTGRVYFQSSKLLVRIRRFFQIKLPIYLKIKHVPRL